MIVPDPPEQRSSQRRAGVGTIAIAVMAVVIGGLTLVSLTSPDPEAMTPTTSMATTTTIAEIEPPIDLENFTVGQLSQGPQVEWSTTLSVVEGYPIALLHHQEMLYLFSTDVPNFSGFDSGGLKSWRSTDGVTWEPLGQVIDRSHAITTVASTGQGLVALERTSGNRGFTVWQSPDGAEWTPDEVVMDVPDEMLTVYPVAAGGTESVLVVTGYIHLDAGTMLRERLGELAAYNWVVDVFDNEVQAILSSPLGWSLAALSADELGLSDKEQERIIDAYGAAAGNERQGNLWVRGEGSNWRQTTIGAAWIDRITTEPDGTIVGHGWGSNDMASWRSSDGLSWEETTSGRYGLDERWGDLLVAPDVEGGTSVLVSGNGRDWEDIGPTDLFPDGIRWSIRGMAAGASGIAAIVSGWNPRQPITPADTPPLPSITNDGNTLILDLDSGELRLERGEETHTWRPTFSTTSPDGIELDLDTATIRFLDRETDELLASFHLDEYMDLQNRALYADPGSDFVTHHAFAFTANGTEWTIQEAASTDDDIFFLLAVIDSQIVATRFEPGAVFTPTSPPGFEVWSAAVP